MALHKSIRWRSLVHGGLEECLINEWNDGIKIRSAIVGQTGESRHGVFSEISLRPDWSFETILLQRTDGVIKVLRRTDANVWLDLQAEELPALEGCVDIDF